MQYKLKTFHTDISVTRIANVHYFEFMKNYRTQRDSHAFLELLYVDKGRILIDAERYSGFLEEQELLIHMVNEEHELSCESNVAPNVIIIGFECDCPHLQAFAGVPSRLSVQNQKLLAEIVKESHNVFMPPYDMPRLLDMKKRKNILFGAEQLVKGLLESLLIKLIRKNEFTDEATDTTKNIHPTQTDSLLRQICQYVDENLVQKLTLRQISLLFATNKTTICRLFREELNQTFVDYINKKRIECAKTMMRTSGKNFSQIAEELNISSVHYFTKLFTKYESMSPGQYVKSLKFKQNMVE
ncbi:MAG: AraC family transcriptional regulator [Clostridiales bacterium]|nr:AraC family transcriptional regulator [Clostridiales bacterium]